jgi:two-component system response regulator AlgR
MRILIVDDEAPARERLRRLLSGLGGDYQVAGEAADGQAALDACSRLEADLVLLDIEMPGMNGLDVADRLAGFDPPPAVVLVTAYPEHALEAFERRVDDYLVKPVRRERLQAALERARKPSRPQRAALERPDSGGESRRRSQLTASYRGGVQTVPVDEVIYLKAGHKYVTVHHEQGTILLDEALKALEEEFPDLFIRIHRNALVAWRSIAGLERDAEGATLVRLQGREELLPVSRRHLAEVRRRLRSGGNP